MRQPSLKDQLEQLSNFIAKGDLATYTISQGSTYWHIDHSLSILTAILQSMEDSNPADYKPKWSFTKSLIMLTGRIPRGKGKSPKNFIPKSEDLNQHRLAEKLEAVRIKLGKLNQLPSGAHMPHPLFGSLKRKEALKFMRIHTHHHIKIIQDIIKASS